VQQVCCCASSLDCVMAAMRNVCQLNVPRAQAVWLHALEGPHIRATITEHNLWKEKGYCLFAAALEQRMNLLLLCTHLLICDLVSLGCHAP